MKNKNYLLVIGSLAIALSAQAAKKVCEVTIQGISSQALVTVPFNQKDGDWRVGRALPHGPMLGKWHTKAVTPIATHTIADYRVNDSYESYVLDSSVTADGTVFFEGKSSLPATKLSVLPPPSTLAPGAGASAIGLAERKTKFTCTDIQRHYRTHFYRYRSYRPGY
jgi:hypothetical protein